MSVLRSLVLVAVALIASCSSATPGGATDAGPDAVDPHAVRASDYDRACLRDSDCILVGEGPIGCCGFGCTNAAIAMNGEAAYQADVRARAPVCTPAPPCAAFPGGAEFCGDPAAACVDGVCAMLTCEKIGCPRGSFCQRPLESQTWACAPMPMACAADAAADVSVSDLCACLAQQVLASGSCSPGGTSCTTPGGSFLVTCTAEARD